MTSEIYDVILVQGPNRCLLGKFSSKQSALEFMRHMNEAGVLPEIKIEKYVWRVNETM